MNTTISISKDIRNEVKSFGAKGETYSDILTRLLASAKERQLQDLLMNSENCVPIEEAVVRAKKKWRK
ncbi:hypothetical protein CMO91_02910 [Candidatus Woesearchaeota archaeon]|nr:hypothetical protein [Candidatus Woesearchaeota archaeon]|tara:strand:+ start:1505 stop:1708 length:204 start_codon:yes stop_codon:yes gene_type:complete